MEGTSSTFCEILLLLRLDYHPDLPGDMLVSTAWIPRLAKADKTVFHRLNKITRKALFSGVLETTAKESIIKESVLAFGV